MTNETRQVVAYIAGVVSSGKRANSVFDYFASEHIPISGTISDQHIAIFDYKRGCHISGNLPTLFHYGNGSHVSLQIKGKSFSGFDYKTSSHFSGTINGNNISVFDYEKSQHFNYSI